MSTNGLTILTKLEEVEEKIDDIELKDLNDQLEKIQVQLENMTIDITSLATNQKETNDKLRLLKNETTNQNAMIDNMRQIQLPDIRSGLNEVLSILRQSSNLEQK